MPDLTPWRLELVRIAERLEAKTKQTRWTARTDVLVERDFVAGAYALQKILRSCAASDESASHRFPVRRIDSGYDVELSRRGTVGVADLCRQILHNMAFVFYCGETADLYDGVYVASDPEDQNVILVIASDFIALCNEFGTENL
jgi:hypothetical protein